MKSLYIDSEACISSNMGSDLVADTVDYFKSTSNAYEDLFFDAIRAAKEMGASDVHIQPTRDGLAIRVRVFGDMMPSWKEIGADHRQAFINQVKTSCGLEIGVSGKPQDGRLALPDLGLDLRVNLLPTLYGEKIVLRLLDRTRRFDLGALGMDKGSASALMAALSNKDGVVLISGPTGSGKTTTLYAMLAVLNRHAVNIITLEDPVEYSIDGISQVKVDRKLTFPAALRAVLRQDPDVILVGEIRDRETAELAFQAASTGHLVLSTIHANSAAQVVTRLTGLGVEPYLIGANLRFAGAQRLARRLCPHCSRAPSQPDQETFLRYVLDAVSADQIARLRVVGDGCEACRCGINGRIPLVEHVSGTLAISGVGARNHPITSTIAQAFMNRALVGETDCREVSHYV